MNPGLAGLIGGLLNVTNEEDLPWEVGRPPPYNQIECALMHCTFYKKKRENKAQYMQLWQCRNKFKTNSPHPFFSLPWVLGNDSREQIIPGAVS